MATNSTTFQLNFTTNGQQIFATIEEGLDNVRQSTERVGKSFGDCFKVLLAFNEASQGLSALRDSLDELLAPGAALNANMLELSAITGVTGEGLKAIEEAARDTAKTFGTSAVDNVEAYKMMLSQLSPDIAKSSEAMKLMGENVNILSKQMGGDTIAATDVLNTSLNQFGVSMEDPIKAAKVMTEMMNVMSAAAQNGSAELPQIKQALEQVGMVAKTTGLSFAETNAYIQLLDQAGKKGSEGGVALRNVLTTLSEGRFTSKLAADGLKAAGISTDYLANSSIPLHERLKALRKIQGDTALMTKVFGKENMAAAIALINTADEAETMTKNIEGTNSAVEQAEVIMGGYNERLARTKVWFEDLKISVFNATEGFMGYVQTAFSGVDALGKFASGMNAAVVVGRAFRDHLWKKIAATQAFSTVLSAVRMGFMRAMVATRGFSVALMNIPFIGWIAAAVTAIVVAFKLLWDNCKKFREVLYGIWEAAKAVFYNIGLFLGRLWELVFKPVARFIFNIYKSIFLGIWEVVKAVVTGIGDFFYWIWNDVIKPVGEWIWELLTGVFTRIWQTGVAIWNWLKETFGGFFSFLDQSTIQPIYNAFSRIWDWITDLFHKLMAKVKEFVQPIIDLWDKLFSSEGMKSVTVAYQEGTRKGAESYDNDHKDKPQEVTVVDKQNGFDLTQNKPTVPTVGGVAATKTMNSTGVGGDKSKSENKVRNLSIGKMMDNFNVYMNTEKGIDKQQLLQAVTEILRTAAVDFASSND